MRSTVGTEGTFRAGVEHLFCYGHHRLVEHLFDCQAHRPTIQTVAAACATSHGTLEAKTQSASGGPSGRARPTLPASGALVGSRSKGSATPLSSNRARRMALEP